MKPGVKGLKGAQVEGKRIFGKRDQIFYILAITLSGKWVTMN